MFGSTSTREQRTTSQSNAIPSTLSGGSVNVLAGNDATLEGVKIDAQGDASVVAMNRLIVGPAYNTSTDSYSYESTSTGLGMGSRTQADQLAQSTLQRTEISANNPSTGSGGSVTLRSLQGDAYVSGTTLNAPGTVTLGAANGRLYLDGAQTQTITSHQSSSSDLLMQEAKGEGGTEQVTNYNQINAGRIVFDAPAITAQIGSRDSLAQLANQPGMGWLNQLSTDPALGGKVDWVTIQDASSHWQYQQQGLTPAAAALVTVAVGYFTAGMGAEFAGAVGMSTTTTAGAAFAGAASAAITALGSRVVIAFAAHPGDLGAVLQDLGSSDSVKGLVSAILTCGALGALDLNALGQATAGGGAQSFPTQLAQNIQGGLARAVINAAVFGGSLEDNIKANLLTSLIDTVAAQGAFAIGDMNLDDFANKAAHALAGCAAGAARKGGSCEAGALGAVVGEISGEQFGFDEDGNIKPGAIELASLLGASAAVLAGMDSSEVELAAAAAGNAAANNALQHYAAKALGKLKSTLKALELKPLVDSQRAIADYLESAAARGGLNETELAALGTLYALNEALFPTSLLDTLCPLGKAVGKAGKLVKAGVKAEEAASSAVKEVRAAETAALKIQADEFTTTISKLSPGDRVAVVKTESIRVAEINGFEKNSRLTKLNNRDVYTGPDGKFYALDTQHGTWEVLNSKGIHQGEVGLIDFSFKTAADTSGKHNIKIN